MPKITQNANGGTIRYDIDDWFLGLEDTSAGNNTARFATAVQENTTAFRTYGYLTVGYNPQNVTTVSSVTSLLRNGVVNGDFAYFISNGTTIQKLSNLSTGTISTTSPFPHTITHGVHSSLTGSDIVNYYNYNSGTQKLGFFYSFSDGTDWDVGFYDYLADTFDDDFMSTVPTTPLGSPYLTGGANTTHPLTVGDDDILYMGDRNFIHAYDQSTGVFSAAVLTLPRGWIITSFCKTNDLRLAIGAYYSPSTGTSTFNRGEAKVWFWNYLALDPDYARDLHDNYVSEIVNWNGTIAAFSSGRKGVEDKGISKLQALVGTEFQAVKSFSDDLPIRGGVDIVGTDLYWNSSGKIYSYTKLPHNGKYVLNQTNSSGGTLSGMLKFLTASSRIHLSSGTDTNGGLQWFSTEYNQAGLFYAVVAIPGFSTSQQGRLKSITIGFLNSISTDSRSVRINTVLDQSETVTTQDYSVIPNNRILVVKTKVDGTPLGNFTALQPEIIFSNGTGSGAKNQAPYIQYLEYEFDYINVPL